MGRLCVQANLPTWHGASRRRKGRPALVSIRRVGPGRVVGSEAVAGVDIDSNSCLVGGQDSPSGSPSGPFRGADKPSLSDPAVLIQK